jgi:hypothetical protein
MTVDDTIRRWAREAGAGERMVILAEADGRGDVAWTEMKLTAFMDWAFARRELEESLEAVKRRATFEYADERVITGRDWLREHADHGGIVDASMLGDPPHMMRRRCACGREHYGEREAGEGLRE